MPNKQGAKDAGLTAAVSLTHAWDAWTRRAGEASAALVHFK